MTLLAKGADVSWMLAMPSNGNKTSGSNAVTAIGTASVAHQMASQDHIAAVRQGGVAKSSGAPLNIIRAATRGPSTSPTF